MKYTFCVGMTCLLTQSFIYAETDSALQELGSSTITGSANHRISSIGLSAEELTKLSGGGSVIDADDWKGQITKPEDIFQLSPGVYARSNGTANDTRLSVRGSGIQRRYGARGVSLQIDGLSANDADGSYYFRAIDPQSISHIEVFRGGNGLRFGSSQLGGSISVHQKNGLTHPGTYFSTELGSFETRRHHISTGGSNEKWDWFFGFSHAESDGYRHRQNWSSQHLTFNLGYQWSDSATTRFYILHSDSDALLPGGLTPAEFAADPKQGRPGQHSDTDRDLHTIRVGQVTKWTSDRGSWSFFSNYQYLDFDHLTGFGLFTFNNLIDYDTDSFSLGLRGEHHYEFANLEHTFYANASAEYGRNRVGGFSGFVTPMTSAGTNDREDTSVNLSIYLENDTTFNEAHHAILGLGYQWSERRRTLGATDTRSTAFDTHQEGFTGKIGYLYKPSEQFQVFSNLSQSFETAPFSEAASSSISNPQTALTLETGTRYQNDWFKGELTLYVAEVNEEFVYQETAPNSGVFAVENADTRHRGIEASSAINLNKAYDLELPVQLDFELSYQLNDHTFREGPAAGNQIPALSKHVVNSRFSASTEKWLVSLSVDWLPSGLIADNNNTLETDGYTLTDLYAQYQINKSTQIYAGISNLTDRQYVSTVTVNPSASSGYINPGDGRSGYIGVRVQW